MRLLIEASQGIQGQHTYVMEYIDSSTQERNTFTAQTMQEVLTFCNTLLSNYEGKDQQQNNNQQQQMDMDGAQQA